MRTLNNKQKELLKKWLKSYLKEQNKTKRINIHNIMDCLDYDVYKELKNINDFETINQEIENFISDLLI